MWSEFFFLDVFTSHFSKIHRSVLHKIPIDPLYFWDIKKKKLYGPFYGWGSTTSRLQPLWGGSLIFTILLTIYDVSLWEKKFQQKYIQLIYAEQISLYNFIILREKKSPTQMFSCGISETFKSSGGCFWKHITFYYIIKSYVGHKLAIFNAILLLYCIYYKLDIRLKTWAWCGVTLRGMCREQKLKPEMKRSIAHAVICW